MIVVTAILLISLLHVVSSCIVQRRNSNNNSILKKFVSNEDIFTWRGVISHHEAGIILDNKSKMVNAAYHTNLSIDLGYSTQDVVLTNEGIEVEDNTLLATWEEISAIYSNKKKNNCYSLYDDGSKPSVISTVSKKTGFPASLFPPINESGAPTLVLGGKTMHRIVGDNMNPTIDTQNKLSSISMFKGAKVLDTCMGLGYTAILAAEKGGAVTTIEYDPASLELCYQNPWSQRLFDESLPIDIKMGDVCEIIKHFKDNSFNFIVHDPPALCLSKTDIYGQTFYRDLRRVLATKGTLFHYIGNPSSAESGKLYAGITARLREAGFTNISTYSKAFGLVASS